MYIIKITQEITQAFELRKLDCINWPAEAQRIARLIISNPAKKKQLDSQLPGMQRDWLINQIENYRELSIDDL